MANANPNVASDRDFIITRVFDAPRELVFQAWTDPKHMAAWWGPQKYTNPICQLDPRPGGTWRIVMRGPEGADHPAKGVYREVVRPERLVFTIDHSEMSDEWHDVVNPHRDKSAARPAIEILTTVTFEDLRDKTKVTIRLAFESAAVRDSLVEIGMNEGWSQSLDRLSAELSGNHGPLVIERTLHSPVANVWNAITDRDAMHQWYFQLAEFKPEVGFQFGFDVEHQGNVYRHRCKVTKVVPEKVIAYTWRYEDYEGESLVTFELFPDGQNTKIRLTHSGLDTFPKLPDFARESFTAGWTEILGKSLKSYVEK